MLSCCGCQPRAQELGDSARAHCEATLIFPNARSGRVRLHIYRSGHPTRSVFFDGSFGRSALPTTLDVRSLAVRTVLLRTLLVRWVVHGSPVYYCRYVPPAPTLAAKFDESDGSSEGPWL